ncbi:MAG TPA: endonuclease domain-containing protein [Sphingobacteriaceae bacterium]
MDASTFRKALRRNSTTAEKILWFQLRGRKFLGLKFRRQHTIGKYTVDFYCSQLKLIIEVDGGVHDNQGQANYDQARTEELESLRFYIYRVDNESVINHTDTVLEDLKSCIENMVRF